MALHDVPLEESTQSNAFRLPLWNWLGVWALVFVGGPVAVHAALHGFSAWQLTLSFFLAVNLLICIWEISLWHRIDDIRRWFALPRGTGDRPRGNLYTTAVSLRD